MITANTFRNSQWSIIDPVIEAQNARLPEGWIWECGGMSVRLHGPKGQAAWVEPDGQWIGYPPEYENGLGSEEYTGMLDDFESALKHVTDMALAFAKGDKNGHTD